MTQDLVVMRMTEEQAGQLRHVLAWVDEHCPGVLPRPVMRALRLAVPVPPRKKPDTKGDR